MNETKLTSHVFPKQIEVLKFLLIISANKIFIGF